MKILISVDIEGVAGVCEPSQGQRGNAEYETARRLMTAEANAAIEGAFQGGATDVTVVDSHGPMRNMIVDDLDARVRIVSGKPRPLSMIQGLTEAHAGVILIGYHSAAGEFGNLSHTISGLAFARIYMNGLITGEPTLFAGYAGEIGVPLLAASGDDRLCQEIKAQFPKTRRIQSKIALGAQASESLSPQASRNQIRTEVEKAVRSAATVKPHYPSSPPLNFEVEMMKQVHADAIALLPFVARKDARTVTFTTDHYAEAIGILSGFALMAQALTPPA